MDEDEALLAAFLAEPENASAQLAYQAWLSGRGDPRGEYLHLLASLDDPTDPDEGGPARQRLRELRGQIATAWADRVDRTLLATGGVYQSQSLGLGWEYLRFYSDGTVLSVISTGTPEEIRRWFARESLPRLGLARGSYTLSGDRLSFSANDREAPSPYSIPTGFSGDEEDWRQFCEDRDAELAAQSVDYAGVAGRRVVSLRWYSHINGARGVTTYRFVEQPSGLPGEGESGAGRVP
jgi:uncharacterized protein (TIGR02996 family)